MEFFEFANIVTTEDGIRKAVTIDILPTFCEEIESVDTEEALGHVVFFVQWGRYHIKRDEVMGGVRFWVADCPNALAWTITTGQPPHSDKIVIHATFNRTEHHQEFINATKALLLALKNGLEASSMGLWSKPDMSNPSLVGFPIKG